jgi:hypothetical protein
MACRPSFHGRFGERTNLSVPRDAPLGQHDLSVSFDSVGCARQGIQVNKARCASKKSIPLVAIEPRRTRMPSILRSKDRPVKHGATEKEA